MKSIKGFTLIELVLWMAIAAGLAAIALPANTEVAPRNTAARTAFRIIKKVSLSPRSQRHVTGRIYMKGGPAAAKRV